MAECDLPKVETRVRFPSPAQHIWLIDIQSDLFDNVSEEYFDQIFANGPFFEGEILDPMDYACYGAKIFIENLFSNLSHYLDKNGKLLIVMSTWSDLDHFEQTAEKNSLSILQMNSRTSADGERVYNIYQVEAV